MSGNKDFFEDLVIKDLEKFKELGDMLAMASIRTLAIKMGNDNGRNHLVQIPNSVNVPNLQITLFFPQH